MASRTSRLSTNVDLSLPVVGTLYRWHPREREWQFFEPAFGGWTTLRVSGSCSSAPMTYDDGRQYLAARGLYVGYVEPLATIPNREQT